MGTMIDLLGEKLSNLSGKPMLACRGIIRFAIKDEYPDYSDILDIEKWKKVIQNSLFSRLERMNFQDPKSIISSLLNELKTNQSIITIANI